MLLTDKDANKVATYAYKPFGEMFIEKKENTELADKIGRLFTGQLKVLLPEHLLLQELKLQPILGEAIFLQDSAGQ